MVEQKIGDGVRKEFFIDTNTIMLNPWAVFKLASCPIDSEFYSSLNKKRSLSILDALNQDIIPGAPNNVYISPIVEWELNHIKDSIDHDTATRFRAREAIKVLTRLKRYGKNKKQYMTRDGITLKNGSVIKSTPYDEAAFKKDNSHLYEPTRDDRIGYDYLQKMKRMLLEGTFLASSINNWINNKSDRKSYAIKLFSYLQKKQKKSFEFVTEDRGFEGKMCDLSGLSGIDILCQPLLSERTKSKNPAQAYTGLSAENIVLPVTEYENLFKEKSVAISDISKVAVHSIKNLESLINNQFVRFVPDLRNGDTLSENLPLETYMRKSVDTFKSLKCYNAFLEKEFPSDALRKKDIPELANIDTCDPAAVQRFITETSLIDNDQRSKLKNKLGHVMKELAKENEGKAEPSKAPTNLYKVVASLQSAIEKHEVGTNTNFAQTILTRPFHPDIQPVEEQMLAVELLNDPAIGLVSFVAPQGAGKTYFTIASGISQIRKEMYDKMVYIRPLVVSGEDIGYLKGSQEQKIEPYMRPSHDTIQKLFALEESESFYALHPELRVSTTEPGRAAINTLVKSGNLKYEILTYIAGTNIERSFIVVDEAQLYTREQLKMLIGRIGEGSKMVLIGDFGQLDAANSDILRKYKLNSRTAGLSHLIENVLIERSDKTAEYQEIYGHISIDREFTKRSRIAGIANLL